MEFVNERQQKQRVGYAIIKPNKRATVWTYLSKRRRYSAYWAKETL
jgi:hypothetical protein